MKWLTGKTIAGAFAAAFGYLAQPEVFALLPGKAAGIVTVAGALLSVLGLRHAVAKASPQ
jgi:hypothetical protein